ncbi:MAG: hypothetical protein KGJ30_02105, partial [Burkholderiales bacterium]|nr:hypothetical protein [Burkholderiales bacterium]
MIRTLARPLGPAALGLALLLAPALARAQQAPTLRWSGYGTLGLTSTDNSQGWRFSRELMAPGAGARLAANVDTRLGIQANAGFSPRLDGVAQVLARDRFAASPVSDWIQLAFLRYSLLPDLSLSLGRTSPDIFLYANTRNVGLAMPWVRPPVELYGWIPFSATDGLDLDYRWRTDSADWKLNVSYGDARAPVAVAAQGTAIRVRADGAGVLSLTRESGGLLLKASYVTTRARTGQSPAYAPLVAGLEGVAALPLPGLDDAVQRLLQGIGARPLGRTHYLGVGLQYDFDPWRVDAEYSRVVVGDTAASGEHGYLSLGRRFGDLTAYVLHAWTRPQRAPEAAPQLPAQALPPAALAQAQFVLDLAAAASNVPRMDQRTSAIGLRWDLRPRLALKLQVDRVRIGPSGAGLWMRSTPAPATATVTSLALDF